MKIPHRLQVPQEMKSTDKGWYCSLSVVLLHAHSSTFLCVFISCYCGTTINVDFERREWQQKQQQQQHRDYSFMYLEASIYSFKQVLIISPLRYEEDIRFGNEIWNNVFGTTKINYNLHARNNRCRCFTAFLQ